MTVDAPIRFELREYQRDALDRIAAAEQRGVRKQLGVAATGLGKTVIFCALAAERGGRTLILAHRDELVAQAAKKITEVWPGVDVGIVKAGENDVHAQVIVASVQTLSREKRLRQLVDAPASLLRDTEPLDLVVVDEAHHAAADSYRAVIAGLGAGLWSCSICGPHPDSSATWCGSGCGRDYQKMTPGPLLLGVTATPDRGDGVGLDDVFDEIVWNYDILWGIRSGFLADVRAKRITLTHLDLSKVKVSRGDYDAGAAGRAMEDAAAPEYIVKGWTEHAADRQTLVFTPTVDLADQVAAQFRHKGVRAEMVCGATPLDERRSILRRYAAGDLQVVANCAVLTEGFDEPRTDCIVVARPTKSRALFTQMVGRGTRRHPDKSELLVLDVVGASAHSLITIPSLFGLEEGDAREVETKNLTDVLDEFEQRKVALGVMRAEEAELFKKMRARGVTWLHADLGTERRYERPLQDDDPTVVIVEKVHGDPESWLCGLHYPDGRKRVLIAGTTLETAQGVGEDFARKQLGARAHIIDANAKWRSAPPTKRAKARARYEGVTNVSSYKTGGELSDAIAAAIRERTRNRKATA